MPMLDAPSASDDFIRAVFKGEPKTGKSIAMAPFPKPMYIFDLENRMKPLRSYYENHPHILKDIEYDTYGPDDFVKVDKKMDSILARNNYATVSMDSLTTFSHLLMNYMLSLRGAGGEKKEGKETRKYMKKGILDLPEIEDYNGESAGLRSMVDFARSLKCNFILTAHVVEIESKALNSDTVISTRTMLTAGRKIAAMLPGQFDEIWHFAKKSQMAATIPPRYKMYTNNAGIDFAGTALTLPLEIDWTDNKDFYALIQEKMKEEKAKKLAEMQKVETPNKLSGMAVPLYSQQNPVQK